jgi:transcriptional regulator with XRE-family HTH domain
MSDLRQLKEDLKDEDYRYAYDEDFSNSRMAMQIKVIRENQHFTQVELAELSGMQQARISTLENINYSSWSVSTLRRLAKALGVRFAFRFESWGKLLDEVGSLSRDSVIRPRFEDDPAFSRPEKTQLELDQKIADSLARKVSGKDQKGNIYSFPVTRNPRGNNETPISVAR